MLVVFIRSREELEKLIKQEPLIVTESSLEGIKAVTLPISLYFGIGLCNGGPSPALSQGLPMDILNLILVSERLAEKKYLLIADTHAKTNGFKWPDIDRVAKSHKETIFQVLQNLGLKGWEIIIASEVDNLESYQNILQSIGERNDYFRRELADMVWFNQEKDVGLKVGWALRGSRNSDETAFDGKFRELFGERISFIYLIPGRTFDPRKPRVAPYFCGDKEKRIILDREEDVRLKMSQAKEHFGNQGIAGYKNFLKNLVRLYDKVIKPTERGQLEDRLQQITGACLK